MTDIELSPHVSTPCDFMRRLQAGAHWEERGILSLRYAIACAVGRVRMPPPAPPLRTDGLWQHTCFEAFLQRPGDASYHEINLSPSGRWAVYRFAGYRQGRSLPDPVPIPCIGLQPSAAGFELSARVDLGGVTAAYQESHCRLGLSAVIEDIDGTLAYWAAAHPRGEPDFHHADSRALTLAPTRFAEPSRVAR